MKRFLIIMVAINLVAFCTFVTFPLVTLFAGQTTEYYEVILRSIWHTSELVFIVTFFFDLIYLSLKYSE